MRDFRNATPEEKLLNIIEKPNEINKSDLNKKNKLFRFNLGKLLLSFKKITLPEVNKILIPASIIATLTLVFFFIKDKKSMETKYIELKENVKKETFPINKKQKDMLELSTYLANTEKNNPFHVLPEIKKPRTVQEEKKVKLKLVGIIWSERPQAIVENKTSKKNYLLSEGDTIDKFEVKKITQNEVKLISENGEKILR